MNEPMNGTLLPMAPGDLFSARGFGNQFIDVIGSRELLVVRFGKDPVVGFDFAALFDDAGESKHQAIVGAVLDAVE